MHVFQFYVEKRYNCWLFTYHRSPVLLFCVAHNHNAYTARVSTKASAKIECMSWRMRWSMNDIHQCWKDGIFFRYLLYVHLSIAGFLFTPIKCTYVTQIFTHFHSERWITTGYFCFHERMRVHLVRAQKERWKRSFFLHCLPDQIHSLVFWIRNIDSVVASWLFHSSSLLILSNNYFLIDWFCLIFFLNDGSSLTMAWNLHFLFFHFIKSLYFFLLRKKCLLRSQHETATSLYTFNAWLREHALDSISWNIWPSVC